MRAWLVVVCLFCAGLAAFGQAATGTITGTVTDPAGAVVIGAAVEAKNTDTGLVYPVATTNTGNYTISQLPVGTYSIDVKAQGFKTYTHTNLAVPAAAVIKRRRRPASRRSVGSRDGHRGSYAVERGNRRPGA